MLIDQFKVLDPTSWVAPSENRPCPAVPGRARLCFPYIFHYIAPYLFPYTFPYISPYIVPIVSLYLFLIFPFIFHGILLCVVPYMFPYNVRFVCSPEANLR